MIALMIVEARQGLRSFSNREQLLAESRSV